MKDFFLAVLIVLVLAALVWLGWTFFGAELSQLPGQISTAISRMLTGIVGGLAGFGQAVRDSFRMPGR